MSLDVVLGACAGMYFFAELLEVYLPIRLYFLLGMAVWVIYTFDHLWDVRKLTFIAHTDRHAFHQRYQRYLWVILLAVTFAGLLLGWNFIFKKELFFIGSVGGILVLSYLLVISFLPPTKVIFKEVLTAILYVFGLIAGPLMWYEGLLPETFYFATVIYILLAFKNLFFYAYMDQESDRIHQYGSLSLIVGESNSRLFLKLYGIILLCLIAIGAFFFQLSMPYTFCLITIALVHTLLIFFYKTPSYNGIYRALADGVFMVGLTVSLFY